MAAIQEEAHVQDAARLVEAAYDQIAAGYDQRWSVHIRSPQQRLTRDLRLSSGMRCADLGCGTGLDTLEMAELTAPEVPFAVDCSQKMLDEARARAQARGYALRTVCQDVESFVHEAEPESFDALSLRFCLAYLPWREIFPALVRMLRPGGRLGILTNLGTSTPQALAVYREMVRELGVPEVEMPVPESLDALTGALARADAEVSSAWSERFELWFESGAHVSAWLQESGFITHPALRAAPAELRRALWDAFASRMERFREGPGIRLDFELAGCVATRREHA
jgi:ubiquinone/menaquinone biosynthesis C-methylase UbiE